MPSRIPTSLLALVSGLATLAGCATSVPIRWKGPAAPRLERAALVFSGPDIASAPPDAGAWYLTRRDARLGATSPSWAPVAGDAAYARPTIERQRDIYLNRSPRTLLFFTPRRPAPPDRLWEP